MTIPLLGPVSLTGFQHIWWLVLFVVVVLGLIGLYVFAQAARRRRLQQFANAELLDSVAPKRPTAMAARSGGVARDRVGTVHDRTGRSDL